MCHYIQLQLVQMFDVPTANAFNAEDVKLHSGQNEFGIKNCAVVGDVVTMGVEWETPALPW